jgi:hypothetical protein
MGKASAITKVDINEEDLDGFTDKESKILIKRLTYNYKLEFSYNTKKFIGKLVGDTTIERLVFGLKNYHGKIDWIVGDKVNDAEDILIEYMNDKDAFRLKYDLDDNVKISTNLVNILSNNTELMLKDKTIDDMKIMATSKGFASIMSLINDNLDVGQVIKYKDEISLVNFARHKDVSLKLIKDEIINRNRQGTCVTSLTRRFFTEEEILQYPDIFLPVHIKDKGHLYVSSKTFKVLKTQHNLSTNWSKKLISFNTILQNTSFSDVTADQIKYLVKKTKATREEVLNGLNNFRNNTAASNKYQENLLKVLIFNTKFKEI